MEHLRMCIVCKARKDKNELLKIVLNKDGFIKIDSSSKLEGRGCYLCSNICAQKAIKTRALNRAFKREIKQEIYEEIKDFFDSNAGQCDNLAKQKD